MPEGQSPSTARPLPESPDRSQHVLSSGVEIPGLTLVDSSGNESNLGVPLQPSSGTFLYPEKSEGSKFEGAEEIQVSGASVQHVSSNTITNSPQVQGSSMAIDGLLILGNMVIDGLPGQDSRIIINGHFEDMAPTLQ